MFGFVEEHYITRKDTFFFFLPGCVSEGQENRGSLGCHPKHIKIPTVNMFVSAIRRDGMFPTGYDQSSGHRKWTADYSDSANHQVRVCLKFVLIMLIPLPYLSPSSSYPVDSVQ